MDSIRCIHVYLLSEHTLLNTLDFEVQFPNEINEHAVAVRLWQTDINDFVYVTNALRLCTQYR